MAIQSPPTHTPADAQKSEEDRSQEECLLGQLMEVVEERNQIIEHMIRDENK